MECAFCLLIEVHRKIEGKYQRPQSANSKSCLCFRVVRIPPSGLSQNYLLHLQKKA